MVGFSYVDCAKMDVSRVLVESRKCPFCSSSEYFEADWELFSEWVCGMGYIQDALPNLTSQDRERFLSGICGECWHEHFSEDDD